MSSHSAKSQWAISIVCAAVLALLFGLWAHYNLNEHEPVNMELSSATILKQPRALAQFNLTDANNQPFTLDNLKGHWNLIFFGFTNCPDLCPTTLSTLNKSYLSLANTAKQLPQVVFISIDPEQDTTTRLKKYLTSFNSNFLGATGKEKDIYNLSQELSIVYGKVQPTDAKNYTFDHSGTILIVDPKGQFYGVFTLPHDAQKIADDMQKIMNQAEPAAQA
jgi:protein SCO1/2